MRTRVADAIGRPGNPVAAGFVTGGGSARTIRAILRSSFWGAARSAFAGSHRHEEPGRERCTRSPPAQLLSPAPDRLSGRRHSTPAQEPGTAEQWGPDGSCSPGREAPSVPGDGVSTPERYPAQRDRRSAPNSHRRAQRARSPRKPHRPRTSRTGAIAGRRKPRRSRGRMT